MNTYREDIDSISSYVTDIRGPDISGKNVPGPCSKSTAPGEDDTMVVARIGCDTEVAVLRVRPITDGDAVAYPRPGGRSAVKRARAAAVIVIITVAGISLSEHSTLGRSSGGGGLSNVNHGGVIGDGFALEIDRDLGAGVNAGHKVFRNVRGGSSSSSISGRGGESSLAEDGQEREPGKIGDEHT